MPSASGRTPRICALAVCGLLLAGSQAGCTTTQETAARKQAESKRFLEAREARRERKAKTNPARSQPQ